MRSRILSKGKIPFNAECEINYLKRSAKFRYLVKPTDKKIKLGYAFAPAIFLPPYIILLSISLSIFKVWLTLSFVPIIPHYPWTIIVLIAYLYSGILLALMLSITVSSKISLFLFKHSKWLRNNYAKLNGYMTIRFHRKIDLSRPLDKRWIICGNTVYFLRYNVLRTDYWFEGDCVNHIKRVYTKFCGTEKQRQNIMTTKFILIFEFLKKPKGYIHVVS